MTPEEQVANETVCSVSTKQHLENHLNHLRILFTKASAPVDALKAGGSPRVTVRATPVVTTDRAGANEVSSIVLPIDLADGFYNLADAIEGAGGKASSASVIHVSHIAGP